MKKIITTILLLVFITSVFGQRAVLRGNVKDIETGETLVGATVVIDGTVKGAMTDFDGNFLIAGVDPGTVNLKCSFISYGDQLKSNLVIADGEELVVNFELGTVSEEIDEVQVVAQVSRESHVGLMMLQKESSVIKESIGAAELSNLGISDASGATQKISGVTKSEGSGDIYIRGLGDRYLMTTMNGLPIPSDDVDNKNIDLNLFTTDIIKNVSIDKTYAVSGYADQTSGIVDVASKTSSDHFSVQVSSGLNSNVGSVFSTFKSTQNMKDVSLGYYNGSIGTEEAVQEQSWNTESRNLPVNYGVSVYGGGELRLFDRQLSIFGTASYSGSSEYSEGVYQSYRSNILNESFTDATTYITEVNSTALFNFSYQLNKNHTLAYNTLFVHTLKDNLYESGRNGEGFVFDQDPSEYGAFVRDQNLKTTLLFINQFHGDHILNEKNKIQWAVGLNNVVADEPNRIRNEVNILDENTVQFAHVGDYQQRKSNQKINDLDVNAFIKESLNIIDEEDQEFKLDFGVNARYKTRGFRSLFIGVRAKGVQVSSIDNLDQALLDQSLYSQGDLVLRNNRPEDTYNGQLSVYSAYVNSAFKKNSFSGSVGVRFEMDDIDVDWDVTNYPGRYGDVQFTYHNFLPAINLKYDMNSKQAVRFAASKTITLPEFKEIAPFEYNSPTGRVTKGNPELVNSDNYNLDFKWEYFPRVSQLFSASGFYKLINDPINLAQTRGSSGYFYYGNTGDKANVYGLEMETRFSIIRAKEDGQPELKLVFNATKMWFNQDLSENFQYNNKTEVGLQGASDFIANGSLSFESNRKNEFSATASFNYSSDKIYALGAPEDFEYSSELFNNEIIEKGFVTVDVVLSQEISKRASLKFTAKNLLNPVIEQTQFIEPFSGASYNAVVNSYQRGVDVKLGLRVNLN